MSHNKNISLIIVNGRPATTSREIAKHFNKRHKNVLRDIKNLNCSPHFTELNFQLSEYKDTSGKMCKEYIIYRDGFIFLTMGFTGKIAGGYKEDYIYAFNRMENDLQSPSQMASQQHSLTLDDLFNVGHSLQKTFVEVTHTRSGEIIGVDKIEQKADTMIPHKAPTIPTKPSWLLIVETLNR